MATKRVVVITGGGSGMGKAMAHRFAEAGDLVYVLGRRLEKLEETAEEHNSIKPIVCDVTDLKSIHNAHKEITKHDKTIDVLINNAGGASNVKDNVNLSEAAVKWEEIIKTNLSSVFNMIFAFRDMIRSPGGRIINITSTAALGGSSQGGVRGQAYSASKSGIHGLSRTLVKELGPEGITINCIAPGFVKETDFFSSDVSMAERIAKNSANTPIQRVGEPTEIASAAFYLASDEAGFITGEILNINGGVQFGR
jgi:3-oxoacyl-[acyl-carrier protein] reductase